MKATYLLFIIALAFGACKSKTEKTPTAASKIDDNEIITVRTVPVTEKTIVHDVVASGILASKNESRLSFKTGGVISKIFVKEGDRVSAGQLLATLDLTEINSQVNAAKLGVDKAQRDLERAKHLFSDTVATLEQVQNATTGYDVATQNYSIAQFNQKFSEIRAPQSGVVIRKLMNEGELAGPGTPVFFMNEATSNDWVLRVGVPDMDWGVIKTSDKADVVFDAYPTQVFSGRVTKTADMADPMSGLYEIEVAVSPNGKKFASGLFGHLSIKSSQASKLKMIPAEALLEGNGKSAFVYVLNPDGKGVRKVPILVGYLGEKEIGVAHGLEHIGAVVTDGSAFLTERSVVKLAQ